MPLPDFRQLMRATMKAKKVSQTDLAGMIGSTQSYMSQILKDGPKGKMPSRPMVKAIAQALDANVDEFLLAAGYAPENPQSVSLTLIDGGLEVPEGAAEPDEWERSVLEKIGGMNLGTLDPRRGGMLWKMSKARRRRVLRHFEAILEEEQGFMEETEDA